MPNGPLLEVSHLGIDLLGPPPHGRGSDSGKHQSEPRASASGCLSSILADVSFSLMPGEIAGLFGESGSGKTTLAHSLLGLLPRERFRVTGSIRLGGQELVGMAEKQFERLRGSQISLVFQDPLAALNPVLRIETQLREAGASKPAELLQTVELAGSPRILRAYAHQLSGGERQRVVLALALARRPALVIADEPFTALDAIRVDALSGLFERLRRELGTAFLIVSHSPGVLARLANRVFVMYGGRLVEQGATAAVMERPLHPYTAALRKAAALEPIPGNPPGLAERARGCPFEPRCADRLEICAREMPPESMPEEQRLVRCFRYDA